MNEQEVAEKIHASMLEYLGSKRYPNMTHDQIIAECPNMWRKLEEERLIVSGMSYKQFITHAKKQKMVTQYAESVFTFRW